MRWYPLEYRDPHPIHWLWIWIPAIPLLAIIGLTLAWDWIEKQKRKLMGPSKEWRPWFAWYPVIAGDIHKTVWLEWVERRQEHTDWREYRTAADT